MSQMPPDSGTMILTPELLVKLGVRYGLTPHPDWECPTAEEVLDLCPDAKAIADFLRGRHEAIRKQLADPLRYGWESEGFRRARRELQRLREAVPVGVIKLLLQGGNRSAKTEFCAKYVMETLLSGDNKSVVCFQQSEAQSRKVQQERIHRYLPPEFRPAGESKGLKRGGTTNVRYTKATGFSNNTFVLPNGSQCEFKFYEGSLESMQGQSYDLVWFDELVPAAWVDDLAFRLIDRNGTMLVSFTVIEGYSDTVALFRDGAVSVEEMDAELLPQKDSAGRIIGYQKVPLVESCPDKKKAVVFFPLQENFYGNYPVMVAELANADEETIKQRAYGVASKLRGAKFTNWDEAIHILHDAGYQRMLQAGKQLTWYHIFDPAGGRNPFMQWWAVTAMGQWILMREWPQPGDYIPGIGAERGVWATTGGSADGKAGPAQPSFKFGPKDMAREIYRVESELGKHAGMEKIEPESRYMDSRSWSAPNASDGGATTFASLFEDLGIDDEPGLSEGKDLSLDFEQASGRQSSADGTNWIDFIQAKLVPDKHTRLAPVMFAHVCRNTIFSLQTWTGEDGQKGACKDPIDCCKYFFLSDPDYIEPPAARETWSGKGNPALRGK